MHPTTVVKQTLFGLLPALLTALALWPLGQLTAQDLHIHYDAFTEEYRILRGDKEVDDLAVRKGKQVFLHIDNYNNYLYQLEILRKTRPASTKSNMGVSNLIGMLAPGGAALNPMDMLGTLSGTSESTDLLGMLNQYGYADNKQGQQIEAMRNQFSEANDEIVKIENSISRILEKLNEIQEVKRLRNLTLDEVTALKYNPNIPPVRIGELSLAYLEEILPDPDNAPGKSDQQKLLTKLQENSGRYIQQVQILGQLSEEAGTISTSDPAIRDFLILIKNTYTHTSLVAENLKAQQESIAREIARDASKEFTINAAIRQEYEEIKNNTFSHTYRTNSEGEDFNLQVVFIARDSLNQPVTSRRQELAPIEIISYGGLKVNASVGVSFAQFFDQPQSYYARDTILRAEDESNFIPFLTTLIHFYPQSRGNISVGGSFGAGIPLTTNEGIEAPAFFLGPSVIVGKDQRLTISGGLMSARIARLSQGYQVGDRYVSDADVVPTRAKYELGGFIGLSFNLD